MSAQDAFERILVSLHEAALNDTQWPVTSALIDEACDITGNGLVIGEGPKDAIQAHFVGFYYRGERREDLEREYLEAYRPIDERIPRAWQLPDSHLVHITELYTDEELKTSPTYNELMAWGNAQDSLNIRLDGLDGSSIGWSLQNPVTPGGWGSSQLALIRGLLPHIRQFVRVRQALVKAEALDMSETGLFDNSRLGVIYLNRRGQIMKANDRAHDLLRCGDGICDRDGELRARVPADRARFGQLLASALPTSKAPAVSGSMRLRRSSTLLPFVVHIRPLGGRQPDYGAWRVAAQVLIVEPGRRGRLDPTQVAEALGLTPGESQVAVWLAEGQTVREIAAATERSANSIHWHLRHIYPKLGLSRQADLVRLVLSLGALP